MRTIVVATILLIVSICSASAWAQGDLREQSLRGAAPKAPAQTKAAEPPPAAVPGARSRPDSVVPADRASADLPPTEALFDAINRGDIASARDALSRGADLDATNLLGLTPTELSVDLARNDITFLLLSMRGGSSSQRSQQVQPVRVAQPPVNGRQRTRTPARTRSAPIEAATRPQSSSSFASNGGTANPAVGFLGFNAAR